MARRFRQTSFWILAGAGLIGCALELDADGEGKACTGSGRCAAGYACNEQGRCVRAASHESASAGSSAGSDAEAAPEAGVAAGDAGTAREVGEETGMLGDGGTQLDGCATPLRYFADDDNDGVGRNDSTRLSCEHPPGAWAIRGGDCDDANPEVFPGQTQYFARAYTRGSTESFDYDCSGSEDPDPGLPGRAPDCSGLGVTNCSGSGVLATRRTGSGVNPVCGSTQRVRCSVGILTCDASLSSAEAARCR